MKKELQYLMETFTIERCFQDARGNSLDCLEAENPQVYSHCKIEISWFEFHIIVTQFNTIYDYLWYVFI